MQSVVAILWKKREEIDEAVAAVSPESFVAEFSFVGSLLHSKLKSDWNHSPYQVFAASFFSFVRHGVDANRARRLFDAENEGKL